MLIDSMFLILTVESIQDDTYYLAKQLYSKALPLHSNSHDQTCLASSLLIKRVQPTTLW